jgi:hypothetical protein
MRLKSGAKAVNIKLPAIDGSLFDGDFLIDRNGIIQVAYYGNDEGDHLPFDKVKEFSQQ